MSRKNGFFQRMLLLFILCAAMMLSGCGQPAIDVDYHDNQVEITAGRNHVTARMAGEISGHFAIIGSAPLRGEVFQPFVAGLVLAPASRFKQMQGMAAKKGVCPLQYLGNTGSPMLLVPANNYVAEIIRDLDRSLKDYHYIKLKCIHLTELNHRLDGQTVKLHGMGTVCLVTSIHKE